VNHAIYYTIRVCKRGEHPLERRLGHHYEHNMGEIGDAISRLDTLRKGNATHVFHLLRTIVEVVDETEAMNGGIAS